MVREQQLGTISILNRFNSYATWAIFYVSFYHSLSFTVFLMLLCISLLFAIDTSSTFFSVIIDLYFDHSLFCRGIGCHNLFALEFHLIVPWYVGFAYFLMHRSVVLRNFCSLISLEFESLKTSTPAHLWRRWNGVRTLKLL